MVVAQPQKGSSTTSPGLLAGTGLYAPLVLQAFVWRSPSVLETVLLVTVSYQSRDSQALRLDNL